jgi:hypothetical protein
MAFFPFPPITACALTLACLGTPAPSVGAFFQLSLHETSGSLRTVSLACEPAGGSHPKSEIACAALDSAGGDFAQLKPRPDACALIYAPVDVVATGTWRGKPVTFRTTYVNRCSADRDSDGVFGF